MIGYYNYTVVLTYIGTLFGFSGIIYTWAGNQAWALVCLLMAGFCDMFDGKIAATMERTKQEKRFGVQIDSLSDLICFGLLPAMISLGCSAGTFLHIMISAVYVLCALIRLAWFNVDEEERQDREEGGRETYLGLPVTTSALLLPFFISVGQLMGLPIDKLCPFALLLIAIAFISPFSMKKPGNVGKAVLTVCGVGTIVLVMMGVMV